MSRSKVSWPLIRTRKNPAGDVTSYTVDCGIMGGRRIRFSYKTKAEAEGQAALMRIKRLNQGEDAFTMAARDRADAEAGLEMLKPHGVTIRQAAQFYLDNVDVIQNAKTYSQTLAELLRAKEQDGKSARYLQDMRNRLQSAEALFGERLLHTIKGAELDDYLRSLDVGGVTRNNFRRIFSVFFGFGVARRYCLKNPVAQIDVATVEQGKPAILSVPEARALMAALAPELIAPVGLALFAGLRPEAEIFAADHPLDWRHIDLDDRTIDIEKSKNVGSHRYVTIQDNLAKWLKPYAKKHGVICTVDYYTRLRKARQVAVEELLKSGDRCEMLQQWSIDICRHSFASFHCAAFKDSRLTSQEMVHSGDLQIFNRHYRNRVKEAEALAFWQIQPAAVE
jgi:integrase